jgi:hypothetical protein
MEDQVAFAQGNAGLDVEGLIRMTDITLENRLTALEAQHAQTVKERDELRAALTTEKIGRRFTESKFIAERTRLPTDVIEATFRNSFKLENDAVIGYDKRGSKVYSRQRPGEVADFDESLEILISQHPHQAAILKSTSAAGEHHEGDRRPPAGGNGSQSRKTINRAAFNALSPAEKKAHFKAGGVLTD